MNSNASSGGHDQMVNPVFDSVDGSDKPKWWAQPSYTCTKSKDEALGEWEKASEGGAKLPHGVAELAISFGHKARQTYCSMQAWGRELEQKLEADWQEAGHHESSPWQKASAAVKHGWECCVAAVHQAAHPDSHSSSPRQPAHDPKATS